MRTNCIELLGLFVVGNILGGCAVPILVPPDGQLVWAGNIDNATDIENMTWQQYGQIYLVDDTTGHVEGVATVWPGKPRFSFDVPPHHRYRAYFVQQTPPTTGPVAGGSPMHE